MESLKPEEAAVLALLRSRLANEAECPASKKQRANRPRDAVMREREELLRRGAAPKLTRILSDWLSSQDFAASVRGTS